MARWVGSGRWDVCMVFFFFGLLLKGVKDVCRCGENICTAQNVCV